jgi:hypothetical protein
VETPNSFKEDLEVSEIGDPQWMAEKRETPSKIGQLNPKVDQFVAFFWGLLEKIMRIQGTWVCLAKKTSQKHIPSVSINGGIPIAGWFIVENP